MSKYLPYLPLGLIVIISFLLTLNTSLQESAIFDEVAHIPAGYANVKYLDYRLNPEHPPLVKALAAFPLIFQNFNFPLQSPAWQNDVNGQWQVGNEFLYQSGNDADKIINWARFGPILLSLILVVFIYIWAKELIGGWWALLPAFLFAFSPTVLSHGHYVTTDVGAALGIFIASYYFIKHFLEPSRRNLILAGLIFGIAQLMKFSAILLIPFFIFLLVVFYIWHLFYTPGRPFVRALHHLKTILLIFIIGYILVFAVYFLFTFNYSIEKQLIDTKSILTGFAGGPDPNWETCQIKTQVGFPRRLRCMAEINIWLAGNKILRPFGQYLLGFIMVQWRAAGGNAAYFMGELSSSGWWYYFPTVFLLKEPLPSLILILLALLITFWNIVKKFKIQNLKFKIFVDYLGLHFAEFSMLIFVIFYWLISVSNPLNIGVRHILPTLPFIYILTAGVIKKWVYEKSLVSIADGFKIWFSKIFGNLIKISLKSAFISIIIFWYLVESIIVYPYYLSYFNQLGGGTDNGYKYITDSNYDWGQDLKRLKKFVEQNNIQKIVVDYFGGGSPQYYLGDKFVPWWSAKGAPQNADPRGLDADSRGRIEWLAISVNTLQGAFAKLDINQLRKPEDEYKWLKELRDPYKPDAKAGTSIFIYKMD